MQGLARERTRRVMVGSVPLGGGSPVVVQSMTCTSTVDADATLAQVNALVDAAMQGLARERTRRVMVGSVPLGGGSPVVVQSMTCTPTVDADATLAQVNALVDAGCDLVRVTVPSREALGPFERICHESPVPIVADIHFDYRPVTSRLCRSWLTFISITALQSGLFGLERPSCASTLATSETGSASTP